MTILLAPDKFKGSLTAQQVCDAVEEEMKTVGGAITMKSLPMADGGEGTCELLTRYDGGAMLNVSVRDPLFRPIPSGYGISKDGKTAFLEMAKASGLQLLKKEERSPWISTTAGTGDLIRDALDRGVEHIIMGIGGSATNDAGMGMAESLGAVFLSSSGERLPGTGENLSRVQRIDLSGLHPGFGRTRFTIFCDVDNPLYGVHGAAYIFSPQKGANEKMVEALDAGLRHYGDVLRSTVKKEIDFPGAGAGGGLPATMKALGDVTIRGGMDFIIEFTRLEEQIRDVDIVITGEGKLDGQTLSGKVVKGIADLSRKYDKPLIIIAGKNELSKQVLAGLSPLKVITLVNGSVSEKEAIQHAAAIIRQRVKEEIIPLFLSPLPH